MKILQTMALAMPILVGMAGASWSSFNNGSRVLELCTNTNKDYEAGENWGEAAIFISMTGAVHPT